jgi:hypothetical protein
MRLGIVGSRDFIRLDKVVEYLSAQSNIHCIVSGGARGVDDKAEQYGKAMPVPVVSFRPTKWGDEWAIARVTCEPGFLPHRTLLPGVYRTFGQAAYVRNGYIIEFADAIVAFWDGHSRGTEQVIQRAGVAEKLREVVRV